MNSTDFWAQNGYIVVQTKDGSPSLRLLRAPAQEAMHHSGGAVSETLYIYGTALEMATRFLPGPLHVASIGLGLGYNELLVADRRPDSASLTSFEPEAFLWENFRAWCHGTAVGEAQTLADSVAASFSQKATRAQLQQWEKTRQWTIEPRGLSEESLRHSGPAVWNLILYDAFSAATSPQLWDEIFLTEFLSAHVAPEAVFATYACRGSLKRALLASGFQVLERPGFHGKRNSTLAVRASPGQDFNLQQAQGLLRICECTR